MDKKRETPVLKKIPVLFVWDKQKKKFLKSKRSSLIVVVDLIWGWEIFLSEEFIRDRQSKDKINRNLDIICQHWTMEQNCSYPGFWWIRNIKGVEESAIAMLIENLGIIYLAKDYRKKVFKKI